MLQKLGLETRGKDCMKKFCKDLKEHAAKIINYEKKEMIPLTYEEDKSYKNQKVCYICKKGFSTDNKKYIKSEIIVIVVENINTKRNSCDIS